MRAFATGVETELAKQTSAFPQKYLTIYWSTGTLHYSDEPRATPDDPQDAEARVISWGEYSQRIEPGTLGGFGETQILLSDEDDALRAKIDAKPGIQGVLAEVSIRFPGVSWTDRIVFARGHLTQPAWDSVTRIWTFRFQSLESFYSRKLGFRLDRNDFADVKCSAQEGRVIPIAYGNPVLRVPAVLVDWPGRAQLADQFDIHETTLTIDRTISQGHFDRDNVFKDFYIGWPGNFEVVRARFTGVLNETKSLTVLRREFIDAEGLSPGVFSSEGLRFQMINRWEVPDWQTPRINHAIWWYIGGEWVMTTVTMWKLRASQIIIGYEGELTIATGTPWRLGKYPGMVPVWPAGTPITEEGDWHYIANFVPSKSVDYVQVKQSIQTPGGGQVDPAWYDVTETYWTATLNDKTWNAELGREVDDDGVTSVTIDRPPFAVNIPDDQIYVTLKGPVNDSGAAMDSAPDICRHLLSNEWLGNAPADQVNDDAIDAAIEWLANNRNIKTAFCIVDATPLAEVIATVARDATCISWFDNGALVVEPLPEFDDDVDDTLTTGRIDGSAVRLTYRDMRELATVTLVDWWPYPSAKKYTFVRRSPEAIEDLGRTESRMELKTLQRPTSVALAADYWAAWNVSQQADLTMGAAFLNSYLLTFGDIVRMRWAPTPGTTVLDQSGIITGVRHRLADGSVPVPDQIEFDAVVRLMEYEIEAVEVDDFMCQPSVGDLPNPGPNYGFPDSEGETPPTDAGEASDSGSDGS